MPFQETDVADRKLRFVAACLQEPCNMTRVCEAFGISREWGYELRRRYATEGIAGLEPRSRAPHHHGRATPEVIQAAIIELRGARPSWGPKKLRAALVRRDPGVAWPALSVIGDLLRREGLSQPRRRRRTPMPLTRPFAPVTAANAPTRLRPSRTAGMSGCTPP